MKRRCSAPDTRRALDEYLARDNHERNHQGIGNDLIDGVLPAGDGLVECNERLGGLLKFYRRAAYPPSRPARRRNSVGKVCPASQVRPSSAL